MAAHVLGGWRVGGIVSYRTGVPFSPSVSIRNQKYLFSPSRPNLRATTNNPTAGVSSGCGPIQSSGKTLIPSGAELGTPELYFDPCAFSAPAPGTLGNAGRNTMISANVLSMDISLQRDFLLDSKRRLQFRGEIFNFPNHTNFNPPSGGGTIVLSGETPTYTSRAGRISQTNTTARQIQFALRLSF